MNDLKRAELFRQVKARYTDYISSVLWKLTGDRELFTEAMQYALLSMWQNVEKLNGKKAIGYIYKIALTANSKAWRNRVGNNGHFNHRQIGHEHNPSEDIDRIETIRMVRQEISRLPVKQARAIVMRYLEQQDYENIAGKLRCSRAGARSHVSKALAALKDKLAVLAE